MERVAMTTTQSIGLVWVGQVEYQDHPLVQWASRKEKGLVVLLDSGDGWGTPSYDVGGGFHRDRFNPVAVKP